MAQSSSKNQASAPTTQPKGFSHYIILLNPASTNAEMGRKRAAELTERYGAKHVTVVKTVKGGDQANERLLARHAPLLGPRTLLCIAAGDGTVNAIINTIVRGKGLSPYARRTPVLPLWGGNANDLAHMLNGTSTTTPLDELISQGRVVTIYPLACTFVYPDKTSQTRIAACYTSFGATAFAADQLNKPEHREKFLHRVPGGRLVSELYTGLKALANAPVFTVEEDGQKLHIYERTFSNGSRFAKVNNLPVTLTEQLIYQHTIPDKRLLSVLRRVLGIQKARTPAREPKHAAFTIREKTLVQFDGEPMSIPARTQVSIALADQPFYAFSTILHNMPKQAGDA